MSKTKTKFELLTNKALVALARECGLKRSGTKPDLQRALKTVLSKPSVLEAGPRRIASIDMGVRNLSLCQVVVDLDRSTATPTPIYSVEKWITTDISTYSNSEGALAPEDGSKDSVPWDLRNDSLLEVAYSFAERELLGVAKDQLPDSILLERQRHRSQGSPSVLEWVFRVNMFESILAGTIFTMRNRMNLDIPVIRVDPRCVSDYYVRKPRSEISDIKDEKIGLVASWLQTGQGGVAASDAVAAASAAAAAAAAAASTGYEQLDPNLVNRFPQSMHAVGACNGFSDVTGSILKGTRSNSKAKGGAKKKKADDVCDALLQAAAWYNWQHNQAYLRDILRDEECEAWVELNSRAKQLGL